MGFMNRKKLLNIAILLLLTFSLIGCTSTTTLSKCSVNEIVQSKCGGNLLLEGKTVESISISRVGTSMLDIKEPHATYHQDQQVRLQTFIDAIQKANKVNGVVDVAKPDYYITIKFKNDSSSHYFLWLGKDGGAIMNENDTHTMYTIPSYLIEDLNKYVDGFNE